MASSGKRRIFLGRYPAPFRGALESGPARNRVGGEPLPMFNDGRAGKFFPSLKQVGEIHVLVDPSADFTQILSVFFRGEESHTVSENRVLRRFLRRGFQHGSREGIKVFFKGQGERKVNHRFGGDGRLGQRAAAPRRRWSCTPA